jgi:hypothetical protein
MVKDQPLSRECLRKECWRVGALEYWYEKQKIPRSIEFLHHSITPPLHYSRLPLNGRGHEAPPGMEFYLRCPILTHISLAFAGKAPGAGGLR